MHGVVSLLDTASEQKVKALWQDLELNYGLKGAQITPIPHFSWQIAEDYDWEEARALLDELAADILPFTIRSSGLGLFTGEQPVLYLPLVKERMLLEVHALFWQSFEGIAKAPSFHYHPDAWMPHITLAHGDLGKDVMGNLMEAMAFLPLNWEVTIDTLALLYQNKGEQARLEYQVNLLT